MSDSQFSFDALPRVLDSDELPFVLRLSPDWRRRVEFGGAHYRRGQDSYCIDFPLGELGLRGMVTHSDGLVLLFANLGPLYNDWWPLLARDRGHAVCPVTSAGAQGKPIVMRFQETDLVVRMGGPSEWHQGCMATAVLGNGGFDESNMLLAHFACLGVVKVALLSLAEYPSLGDVPDVDIGVGDLVLPLSEMLVTAADVAGRIDWQRVG